MSRIQFSVYVGGEWIREGSNWSYVGSIKSRPILMNHGQTIDELRQVIVSRFNLPMESSSIILTYRNSVNASLHPFVIENEHDLEDFVEANCLCNEPWSIPVCVGVRHTQKDVPTITSSIVVQQQKDVPNITSSIVVYDENVAKRRQAEHASRCNVSLKTISDSDNEKDYEIDTSSQRLQRRYEIRVGQVYKNKKELKIALSLNAIYNCFEYKIRKSKKPAVVARCDQPHCEWRVRFSMLGKSKFFTITQYDNNHTCSYQSRRSNQRKPNVDVIAHLLHDMYNNVNKLPGPLAIQGVLKNEHNIDASYWVCWKSLEAVKDLIRGTCEENYKGVPAYMHKLREANTNSIVALKTDQQSRFKFVFFAFGQSIRGYNALRKVISCDATFLKGKYGGVLMVATAQDANQQIYPMAFAVVDAENDEAWNFFMENLTKCVPDTNIQLFVSDRHMSIKKAIAKHFPKSHHGVCMYHLSQNIKKRSRLQRIQELFQDAAKSYKQSECLELFALIDAEKPIVGQLLKDVGFESWSRAYSPACRYNIMTSNNAETINRVMLDAREYPILALIDEIRKTLSRWFAERREKAEKCVDLAPPKIERLIQTKYVEAARYACYLLDKEQLLYQVKWDEEDELVCLVDKTCTCLEFDHEHIPCVHAIAAAKKTGINPSTLVSPYYTVNAWKKAYAEIVYPVLETVENSAPPCIEQIECNPPTKKQRCGRLPKARFKDPSERSQRKCTCCGMVGHNKKTCRNQPMVKTLVSKNTEPLKML